MRKDKDKDKGKGKGKAKAKAKEKNNNENEKAKEEAAEEQTRRLSVSHVWPGDVGGEYYCVISNPVGAVQSSRVTVEYHCPPWVTVPTAAQTLHVTVGGDIALTLHSEGSGQLRHLWYRDM